MNYVQFDDFEKNKIRQNKFLISQDNESIILKFKAMKSLKMINSFSGEEEDTIQYKFLDEEFGVEKIWNAGSLSVYQQFKNNDIQEEDLVKITKKVEGNKKRYLVEKVL